MTSETKISETLIAWLAEVQPGLCKMVENMGNHDGTHVVRLKVYHRTSSPNISVDGKGEDFDRALEDAFITLQSLMHPIII